MMLMSLRSLHLEQYDGEATQNRYFFWDMTLFDLMSENDIVQQIE